MNPDIVDTAVAAGNFQTLVAALKAADLVDALKGRGPFTVFAPSDVAFARLPAGTVESLLDPENRGRLTAILTYHVVSGRVPASTATSLRFADTLNGQRLDISTEQGKLLIDESQVVAADIMCSNGVIHVIDRVLLPSEQGILDIAQSAGNFRTLTRAIQAAGLAGALQGDGPFTVFAPTDEAFAKLPQNTVQELLRPENRDKLQEILKYHVVSGRRFADQIVGRATLDTLSGLKTSVGLSSGNLQINDSQIISTDIEASNGVVHVIDNVLLPDPERSARLSAVEIIELAINRGVPLFNDGQTTACAAIYEVAAKALLNLGQNLPEPAKNSLREALEEQSNQRRSRDQAWTLRRALDKALEYLDGRMSL
jgi:uncharacterized surface protein with fasciclin (FAS1) repeats